MPLPRDKAWFAAKTYGWGWGLPLRREGWFVMSFFLVALIGGSPLAKKNPLSYVIYSIVICIILVGVCYWKGEKPEWRWGPRD
jgi:uncharacterized membrane protein YhaH (DUF805 family)